jgi:hypothetical protein
VNATAQPSVEVSINKNIEKQEISYKTPNTHQEDTTKYIDQKEVASIHKGEQTMEDVLKYKETQLEFRRLDMINADDKLKQAKGNLKEELERLHAIHQNNPNAQKSIEHLLKKLENDIHELIAEKLKTENINMDNPEFRDKVLPSLKKLILKWSR